MKIGVLLGICLIPQTRSAAGDAAYPAAATVRAEARIPVSGASLAIVSLTGPRNALTKESADEVGSSLLNSFGTDLAIRCQILCWASQTAPRSAQNDDVYVPVYYKWSRENAIQSELERVYLADVRSLHGLPVAYALWDFHADEGWDRQKSEAEVLGVNAVRKSRLVEDETQRIKILSESLQDRPSYVVLHELEGMEGIRLSSVDQTAGEAMLEALLNVLFSPQVPAYIQGKCYRVLQRRGGGVPFNTSDIGLPRERKRLFASAVAVSDSDYQSFYELSVRISLHAARRLHQFVDDGIAPPADAYYVALTLRTYLPYALYFDEARVDRWNLLDGIRRLDSVPLWVPVGSAASSVTKNGEATSRDKQALEFTRKLFGDRAGSQAAWMRGNFAFVAGLCEGHRLNLLKIRREGTSLIMERTLPAENAEHGPSANTPNGKAEVNLKAGTKTYAGDGILPELSPPESADHLPDVVPVWASAMILILFVSNVLCLFLAARYRHRQA